MKYFLLMFFIFFNSFTYSSTMNTSEYFNDKIKDAINEALPDPNPKKDHFNPPSLKEEKSFFDAILADIKDTLVEAKEAGRQAFADAVDSQRDRFNDKLRRKTHLKGTAYEDVFNFFDSFVETDFEILYAKIKEEQAAWDALSDFEQEEYYRKERLRDEAIQKKWDEEKLAEIEFRRKAKENTGKNVGFVIEIMKDTFYFNYAFGGIIAIIIIGFIRGMWQHLAAAFDANYHLKRREQQQSQQQQPKKSSENLSNDKKFKKEMNEIIAKRNR